MPLTVTTQNAILSGGGGFMKGHYYYHVPARRYYVSVPFFGTGRGNNRFNRNCKGENMSRWFCYRWLPRTIFKNFGWAFYVFKHGIENLWKWTPVIFFDTTSDWSSITEILQFKFADMSRDFKKYGHHVGSERDAHKLWVCSVLCKRINDDDYEGTGKQKMYSQRNDLTYLCKLIDKNLYGWWN